MSQKIINQRSDFDCVGASLAMFFNVHYDAILNLTFMSDYKFDRPFSDLEERSVFKHFKARHIEFATWCLPFGGGKAMVSVPSLNLPGKNHAIFYDGKGFLDPQAGRENRKFYDYKSKPIVSALTLDMNDKRSIKCVSDVLWDVTYRMSESLKGADADA